MTCSAVWWSVPGSLAEQWQDELYCRFHLGFEILTNDKLAAARTGNWFLETDLAIARLDKLARDDALQEKLQAPDCRWDLVVCDEAHKMSATFTGGEVRYTKRYHLGQLLGGLTRHFLLLTATPHNGKEEDFQLFMALLDGDRFEGRFRDGVHMADVSDLMRRMVKERLLKFEGTPLFPERVAHTIPYRLSDDEAHLYNEVSNYVREEFNRAEALENNQRAGAVGFALTLLQRRLASSPEAIYQSLRRRRERLESRLRELELLRRGGQAIARIGLSRDIELDADEFEDLEDAPADEQEQAAEEILDQATAARTIAELKTEIGTLRHVEQLALRVRRSGTDAKWRQLAGLLGEILPSDGTAPSTAQAGHAQKLVIFTEHRDTLAYLRGRIGTVLGHEQAIVVIHGGLGREERSKAQEAFRHDPGRADSLGDRRGRRGDQSAARPPDGELRPAVEPEPPGAALRPHPPDRPDRGVPPVEPGGGGDARGRRLPPAAGETGAGARGARRGRCSTCSASLQFSGRPLRDLLLEAIRYGEQPEVRARLTTVLDAALDRDKLQELLEDQALAPDAMDATRVQRVREEMERAAGAAAAAALHRVVLPRGVRAPGRLAPAARAAAL